MFILCSRELTVISGVNCRYMLYLFVVVVVVVVMIIAMAVMGRFFVCRPNIYMYPRTYMYMMYTYIHTSIHTYIRTSDM